MPTATITSKGQVTIPREIRERFRLHAGDRLEFRVGPDGGLRVVPETKRVDEVFGLLAARGRTGAVAVEEMDARVAAALRKSRGA